MKSGRLLEMLLLLQARGAFTAAELAERLEGSPRTVYRDAEALFSAGVPVYTEPRPGRGQPAAARLPDRRHRADPGRGPGFGVLATQRADHGGRAGRPGAGNGG